MFVMLYFLFFVIMPGEFSVLSNASRIFFFVFCFSVVNVASRAGMLESIKSPEIRQKLIAPDASIESISDILSDFIE